MTDNEIQSATCRRMRAVLVGISHARERRSPWWSVNGSVACTQPRLVVAAHAKE
jgi:hypothetical protein